MRDGGSYLATLADDGRTVSLGLKVMPWKRLGDREYEGLYVSAEDIAWLHARRASAKTEREWLGLLESLLERADGDPAALDCLGSLVAELRRRLATG